MAVGQPEPIRPVATRQPRLSLDDSVQYLKGVGQHGAQILSRLDLRTVSELLRHIPRRWDDRRSFRRIADVSAGELASLKGQVVSVETRRPKPKLTVSEAVINDGGALLKLIWFNQPFIEKTFQTLASAHKSIVVYGLIRRELSWIPEIQSPEWEELSEERDSLSANRIVPVYPATEGIRQTRIRQIINGALQMYLPLVDEALPHTVIEAHGLMSARSAIQKIHFPGSFEELEAARRRLVFEEFFLLQTLLALRRQDDGQTTGGLRFEVSADWLRARLREVVPFELTGAQRRTIREIAFDVCSGRLMNRLLQGDVGSGKTVVALAAMLMAVQAGYQAALMAPTEVLAQQHAIVLRRLLEPIGMAVELATGSQPAKEKRATRERLLGGQSRIAVGTHALIQEAVEFARLGLVIVDEQHRFGVLQRQALAMKGARPHVLVMTATPIPRTLTLSIYGDLDVSVLDELPPGRKPITTHWKTPGRRARVYAAVEKLLQQGRQAYIVCPLVEESEKLQAISATQLSEQIAEHVYPHYRVGLLHGQMKPLDRDDVMARFKAHELDVLVSTTVIEVGIDVPNAAVIVIEDADRFGLAQLHQLRGRVGRGVHASYCILIADPKTDIGRARMEIMSSTSDGFVIAEEDLKLRGPGDFCGTRQSGLPEFYIADLIRDSAVLEEARSSAFRLVAEDPHLAQTANAQLLNALRRTRSGGSLMTVS